MSTERQLVRCPVCSDEHDLGDMEPSLRRADPVLRALQEGEDERVREAKDCAQLVAEDGASARCFLRVLMPFEVTGRALPVHWGLWVEVSAEHFERTLELWDADAQADEPAFPGFVANDLHGYPPTVGLAGLVQLRDPSNIPLFTPSTADHPLIEQQRAGVEEARVVEWLLPILHPDAVKSDAV